MRGRGDSKYKRNVKESNDDVVANPPSFKKHQTNKIVSP